MAKFDPDTTFRQIGGLIYRFNVHEAQLARIIDLYIGAEGDGRKFVRTRVLHNSIISYASKVKLVLAIAKAVDGPKLDIQALHRIGHLRNAFAHGNLEEQVRTNFNALVGETSPYFIVETIKNDGSLSEIRREEAFKELTDLINTVEAQLKELEAILLTPDGVHDVENLDQ
jgi:hypothetical protein